MKTKIIIPIGIILVGALLLLVVFPMFQAPKEEPMLSSNRIQEAVDYVNRELIDSYGLIETFPYRAETIPYREGYITESLSETISLWVWILVIIDDREAFDEQLEVAKRHFLLPNDSLSWRIIIKDEGALEPGPYGATIDDLRMARALVEAYEKWGDKKYKEFALLFANAMKRDAVYQDYLLHQPLLEGDEYGIAEMDLSYLDLETMSLLAKIDPDWQKIYQKCLGVLLKGTRPSGFFYDKYEVKSDKYYDFEKNLINQIICAIHLAERGFSTTKFMQLLKNKWEKDGRIYGGYDLDTTEPVVEYESVVCYALIDRLAKLVGDDEFSQVMENRILELSASNKGTLWEGSFLEIGGHSFDHLQALLSFLLRTKQKGNS